MVLIHEFLDQEHRKVEKWSTGIPELDQLVGGGFMPGRIWVLTGAPTSGKSTLLSQFVFALGVRHHRLVDYFTSRSDHPALTAARLRSLARSEAGLEALRASRIRVYSGGGFVIEPLGSSMTPGRCLVIDDPEGKRPPVLAREARQALRATADSGDLVLVTVPRPLCLEPASAPVHGAPAQPMLAPERLREEWASVADVVVEIVPTSDGDAVLHLWQNRWGPWGSVSVTYQHHRSRFLGLPAEVSARMATSVPGEDVKEP